MKNNCIICFESVDSIGFIQKWECSHLFHESCIEHWEHDCPLCRNPNKLLPEITWSIVRNPECPIWMHQLSHLAHITENIECYKPLWKDRSCIEQNHTMNYYQLNPRNEKEITCICENCNTYQTLHL